jgi:hypothetical protein
MIGSDRTDVIAIRNRALYLLKARAARQNTDSGSVLHVMRYSDSDQNYPIPALRQRLTY